MNLTSHSNAYSIDAETGQTYEQALGKCAALIYEILESYARDRRRNVPPTTTPPVEESVSDRVLRALEKCGPLSPQNLRAIVRASPMTLTRSLRKLLASGDIISSGKTRSVRYELCRTSRRHLS